jgi:dienelactone hydrolase
MTTNTLIPSLDHKGEIPAYVAKPEGAPRGTVIVVPEIFGVNPGIVSKADDWANRGCRRRSRRVLASGSGRGTGPRCARRR